MQAEPATTIDVFALVQRIGSGASGKVYEAKEQDISKGLVALKLVNDQNLFQKEVKYLECLQGETNIVQMQRNFTWQGNGVIVLERLDEDLSSYYSNRTIQLSETKMIFEQICLGVQSFHNNNYAHLDLKPNNIFINRPNYVKLGDFGACCRFSNKKIESTGIIGTLFYCAPEIITKKRFSPEKADIWSLGVILHELVTNRWPYLAKNQEDLVHKLRKGKAKPFIYLHKFPKDKNLKRLVIMMLNENPELRPTIDEIIASPWIQNQPSIKKGFRHCVTDLLQSTLSIR